MSSDPSPSVAPIALQAEEGEALWFLGFLVFVKASSESTVGRVTVIEHLGLAAPGRRYTFTAARTNGFT